MTQADAITKKLEDMTHFIEGAHAKLQKGEVINLSHLDQEVAVLCDQTLRLAPQDAKRIQPVMGNMISRLEELGLALKDFQTALKDKNGL